MSAAERTEHARSAGLGADGGGVTVRGAERAEHARGPGDEGALLSGTSNRGTEIVFVVKETLKPVFSSMNLEHATKSRSPFVLR